MCGGKPTSQTNTASSFTPPPQVMQEYGQVTGQAQQVAATPYSAYGGQLVAPVNAQQSTGIGAVNSASGIQNPYNAFAGGLTGASSGAIDPTQLNAAAINQYESPYNADVVAATEAQFQNQNAIQAAQLTGNNISSGAFGGDRAGIAQAALAGQQQTAEAPVIAGLYNQNYAQALATAQQQQGLGLSAAQNTAQRQLAAGAQLGQLGQTAQGEALTEANAQTNAGTLQQTTQQAQDTAAYNQFLQQQAYPFQTTGWLANIVEGIGSQSGGSSTGQTQQIGNAGSQIAGGLVGLGSFLAHGGRVPQRATGGGIMGTFLPRYDAGGGIYIPQQGELFNPTIGAPGGGLGGGSIVPQTGPLAVGNTMPKLPNAPQGPTPEQQAQTMAQTARGVQGLGRAIGNSPIGDAVQDTMQDMGEGSSDAAFGGVLGGGSPLGLGGIGAMARGGAARPHYDDGGIVPLDVSPDGTPIELPTMATGMPAPNISTELAQSGQTPPTITPVPAGLAAGYADQMPATSGLPTAPQGMPAPNVAAELAAQQPSGGIAAQGAAPAGIARAPTTAADPNAPTDILPRNVRNNNPGNLVDNAWTQGLPGYSGSDGKFAIFDNAAHGSAAMDRNLQTYAKQGLTTPLQIISKWAPAGDNNNPVTYASKVASDLGVGINDPINMADPAVRAKLATSIASFEGGISNAAAAKMIAGEGLPNGALAFDSARGSGIAGAPAEQAIAAAAPPSGGIARGSAPGITGGNQISAPQFPQNSPTPASGPSGLLGLNLSPETRQMMLAAGLGIMGGTSRSFGTNVGQGGLQGIQAATQMQNVGSEIGLRQAQTQKAQLENEIIASRVKMMHDEMAQQAAAAAKAAAPSPTTSTITKGTIAPTPSINPDSSPQAVLDRYKAERLTMPEVAAKDLELYGKMVPPGYELDTEGKVVPTAGFTEAAASREAAVRGAGAGAETLAKANGEARTNAYAEAYKGQQTISQAKEMMQTMFNPDGTTNVNSGPLGPQIAHAAAIMEELGVSHDFVKTLTGTDPDKAQDIQKLKTALGSELANQGLLGDRVHVNQWNQFLATTPGNELLGGAFKMIMNGVVIPRAQQQIGAVQAIRGMDPLKDNIQDALFEYGQKNPWFRPTMSEGAPATPPAAAFTPEQAAAEIARRAALKRQQTAAP